MIIRFYPAGKFLRSGFFPVGWFNWPDWVSEVEPTTWCALVLGFVPLGVLGAAVWFELQLTRKVDPALHPFVRFPVSAVVGALLGGWSTGMAGWAVLGVCGTIYLGSHFFDLVRRERGLPTPELPREYDFSLWPAMGVFAWTALSGYACALSYSSGFGATPWELARNLQFVYGGYYLLCYAVYRWPIWVDTPLFWAGFPGTLFVQRGWKDLGETGRTAVVTTAVVTTASLVSAYHALRNENQKLHVDHARKMFKLKSEYNKDMFKIEVEHNKEMLKIESEHIREMEKLQVGRLEQLDRFQNEYDLKGYSYSRVNGRFENVRKEWFWKQPTRVVEPTVPPSGSVPVDKDDVTMLSPLEPGEFFGIDFCYWLPAAVVALVFVVWFYRFR